jgi:hypothetical protein
MSSLLVFVNQVLFMFPGVYCSDAGVPDEESPVHPKNKNNNKKDNRNFNLFIFTPYTMKYTNNSQKRQHTKAFKHLKKAYPLPRVGFIILITAAAAPQSRCGAIESGPPAYPTSR